MTSKLQLIEYYIILSKKSGKNLAYYDIIEVERREKP